MAQVRNRVNGGAGMTPSAAVAPATSEEVVVGEHPLYALITIGGTATTVTLVSAGAFQTLRAARANQVVASAATSTRRLVRIDNRFTKADGTVTVTFSQVTGVTWELLELNPND